MEDAFNAKEKYKKQRKQVAKRTAKTSSQLQIVDKDLFSDGFVNETLVALLELELEFFPSLVMGKSGRSHGEKSQSNDEQFHFE